jgi:hypothetical protein
MSLALRDARVLTDFLRADDDWNVAAHAYAGEHDRYYSVIHSVEDWTTQVFLERGPQADEIRIRALPKLAMDRHVCRAISLQVRTSRSTLRRGRGCLATTRSADCS